MQSKYECKGIECNFSENLPLAYLLELFRKSFRHLLCDDAWMFSHRLWFQRSVDDPLRSAVSSDDRNVSDQVASELHCHGISAEGNRVICLAHFVVCPWKCESVMRFVSYGQTGSALVRRVNGFKGAWLRVTSHLTVQCEFIRTDCSRWMKPKSVCHLRSFLWGLLECWLFASMMFLFIHSFDVLLRTVSVRISSQHFPLS